jgi:hypothetical protein
MLGNSWIQPLEFKEGVSLMREPFLSLCCQDYAERQDLILLITRWTNQHGTDAFVEFWAVARRMFLVDGWEDEASWQQEAARMLGISCLAFRQRKHQFTRWIAGALMAAGYARQEPPGQMRFAA